MNLLATSILVKVTRAMNATVRQGQRITGFGPDSPYYTAEHDAFRLALRRWVAAEIAPCVAAWDEAEQFPRELYRKAAEIGLLQIGYPEAYGGIPADLFYTLIAFQELARAGSGGVVAGLLSHTIGAPPIQNGGNAALKSAVLPAILAGEKISALAVTEPSGGSDIAALKTAARRQGDFYIVNGSKTFITSGMRADWLTTAVRTGGPGRGGVSILLIDAHAPGVSRTPLRKTGWWASDTATLYFDNVQVPVSHLLGEENQGFQLAMRNFNSERLTLAASSIAFARVCLEDTIAYAKERQTFGKPLIGHQVVRHKLVDMTMRVNAAQAYLENLAWRITQGQSPVADICMAKNMATTTLEFCAREATQTFGGAGYIRGSSVERISREVRVNAVGGGAEEIMRDLAARQMGW
jgi:acyl-CoA dehydrogenase